MTFDELGQTHRALRAGVAGARRQAHAEWGTLAATYDAAMKLWDAQRRDGIGFVERLKGLTIALRNAWPKGRDTEWKYTCTNCLDYGLAMSECVGDATCGRVKRHLPHDYGNPCWCQAGARFKVTAKRPADFTEAAQTKQPTRVGRR